MEVGVPAPPTYLATEADRARIPHTDDIDVDVDEWTARLYDWHRRATLTLVGTLVQNVRAPASTLLYNSEYLASLGFGAGEHALTETQTELLSASHSLNLLVNRFSDLERLGENATEGTSARELLRMARQILGRTHDERRVTMAGGFGSADVLVRTNPILAVGLLVEVLKNALDPGPEIQASLLLSLGTNPPGAWFTIEDDGPLIPESARAGFFLPFARPASPRATIGMLVARETARRLGGDLSLSNGAEKNAFVLRLPSENTYREDTR